MLDLAERSQGEDELKIKLILDYNRMTRGSGGSSEAVKSLNRFPDSVAISLCKVPTTNLSGSLLGRGVWSLIGVLSRFKKASFLREVLGVYHIKAFLADDNMIITSANLSSEYLTNKQDRYIMITDAKQLCDYFQKVLDVISEYSHRISPDGEIHPPKRPRFAELGRDLVELGADADIEDQIASSIELRLRSGSRHPEDCTIASYFQCPPLDIKSEESVMTTISKLCGKKETDVFLLTPYLNLPRYFVSLLKDRERPVRIVSGVPVTRHSVGESKTPSLERVRTVLLPKLYSYMSYSLLERLGAPRTGKEAEEQEPVSYYEYKRPNWSFHFKGVYFLRSCRTRAGPQTQRSVIATTFGSSNYNYRSTNRDFECSFVLIPNQSQALEKSLRSELENICKNSVKVCAPKNTWRRLFLLKVIRILHEYL